MARFLRSNQTGDTIVEVMASIAVLGMALGAAYGLSNRSFNTAVHTRDRIEAMALAEGQVEFLKDIGLKGQIATFNKSGTFCFDDNNGARSTNCVNYKGSIYTLGITYCSGVGCSPANVFTVTATWISGGGGDNKQLTLFYKPPS